MYQSSQCKGFSLSHYKETILKGKISKNYNVCCKIYLKIITIYLKNCHFYPILLNNGTFHPMLKGDNVSFCFTLLYICVFFTLYDVCIRHSDNHWFTYCQAHSELNPTITTNKFFVQNNMPTTLLLNLTFNICAE